MMEALGEITEALEKIFHAPVHPMFVHFPIALLIAAFIFQLIGVIAKKEIFQRTAFHIFILAAVLAPLTVLTGLGEAREHNILSHPVALQHMSFALTAVGLTLAVLGFDLWGRKNQIKNLQAIFLVCLFVIACLVSWTAYLGGKLVYTYSVGIEEE